MHTYDGFSPFKLDKNTFISIPFFRHATMMWVEVKDTDLSILAHLLPSSAPLTNTVSTLPGCVVTSVAISLAVAWQCLVFVVFHEFPEVWHHAVSSLNKASNPPPPSLQTQHTTARTPCTAFYIDGEYRMMDVTSDFPEKQIWVHRCQQRALLSCAKQQFQEHIMELQWWKCAERMNNLLFPILWQTKGFP